MHVLRNLYHKSFSVELSQPSIRAQSRPLRTRGNVGGVRYESLWIMQLCTRRWSSKWTRTLCRALFICVTQRQFVWHPCATQLQLFQAGVQYQTQQQLFELLCRQCAASMRRLFEYILSSRQTVIAMLSRIMDGATNDCRRITFLHNPCPRDAPKTESCNLYTVPASRTASLLIMISTITITWKYDDDSWDSHWTNSTSWMTAL